MIEHRVVTVAVACQATSAVADAAMLGSKNIRNCVYYLARNLLTSYEWQAEQNVLRLKATLHESQFRILQAANQAIAELNAYWAEKVEGVFNEDGTPKKPQHLPELGPEITSAALNKVVTHANLMERLLKVTQSGSGFDDYRALPAVIAQNVLQHAVQDVKNHLAARIAYFQALKFNPKTSAGAPQLPAYLDKNARQGFVINAAHFTKAGTLPAFRGDKHTLRSSFHGALLSDDALEAWNRFDAKALVDQALATAQRRAGPNVACRFMQLRCVPETATGRGRRQHGVKWEVVVETTRVLSPQSLRVQAIEAHDRDAAKPFAKLSADAQNRALQGFVAGLTTPVIAAGIDPGITNHATLATTTGRHVVYSGTRQNRQWTRLNEQLDRLKQQIYREHLSPALFDKLARNAAQPDKTLREVLTPAEKRERAEANRAVYAHPSYLKQLQQLQERKLNHVHQLSHDIVAHCVREGVQVLVLGRNKGWKQEVEMGRKTNRLFTTLPHAQLYAQLQYKAREHGILVVTTEESYTSKASFVADDAMPVKGQEGDAKPVMSGRRKGLVYRNKTAAGADRVHVHADLNGALNILRKLLPDFTYRPGFCLRYVLKMLQHRWTAFTSKGWQPLRNTVAVAQVT